MPEPVRSLLRPTVMMRKLVRTAMCLAVVCLASCGSPETEKSADSAAKDKTAAAKVGQCPADSPAVVGARTITTADLDGDGTPRRSS